MKPLERGANVATLNTEPLSGRLRYRGRDRSEIEIPFGDKDQKGEYTLRCFSRLAFIILFSNHILNFFYATDMEIGFNLTLLLIVAINWNVPPISNCRMNLLLYQARNVKRVLWRLSRKDTVSSAVPKGTLVSFSIFLKSFRRMRK